MGGPMSAELGGDVPEVGSVGHPLRDADRQAITNQYDTYAAALFDYCEGILRNRAAAADAVQDTLVTADVQISKLRDPGRLRVWLYCIARRQCLSELPRGSETITPRTSTRSSLRPRTPTSRSSSSLTPRP